MPTSEAQALHDRITAVGGWVMWFVTRDAPGRFIARAKIADFGGGHQKGDDFYAGTLDALQAMLPAGLTRWNQTMMPANVVET